MTDEVWAVVCETLHRYKGQTLTDKHKAAVERECRLVNFDGGCFVIKRNEIDLFVIGVRRKRWATRRLLDDVVGGVIRDHGKAICRIHKDNADSLEFAKRLGFRVTGCENDVLRLEAHEWKLLAR